MTRTVWLLMGMAMMAAPLQAQSLYMNFPIKEKQDGAPVSLGFSGQIFVGRLFGRRRFREVRSVGARLSLIWRL